MASSDLLQEQDCFNCPICFDEYSSDSTSPRAPVSGQCNHNCCRSCMEAAIQTTIDKKNKHVVNHKCPLCNMGKMFRAGNLVVNIGLCQSLELFHKAQEEIKSLRPAQEEIQSLQTVLQNAQKEIKSLLTSKLELFHKAQEEIKSLRPAQKEIQSLRTALENAQKEIKTLRTSLENAQKEIMTLRTAEKEVVKIATRAPTGATTSAFAEEKKRHGGNMDASCSQVHPRKKQRVGVKSQTKVKAPSNATVTQKGALSHGKEGNVVGNSTTNRAPAKKKSNNAIDLEAMRHWLLNVPHGKQQKPASKTNASMVVNVVRKLVSGKGITYKQWGPRVFMENVKIDLSTDFVAMRKAAQDFEDKHGEDKGHGWVIRHPLTKLQLYKEYLKTSNA